MTTTLLQLTNIEHSFRGLKVLRNVNLSVPAQGITGLIGPNGAGKSTLFNIVSGYLKPSSGEVHYDGTHITGWNVTQRAKAGLIRTFQTPKVFSNLSVGENLMTAGWMSTDSGFLSAMLGLGSSKRDSAAMARLAESAATRFDLQSLWDTRSGDLPAGRQRLVELARATVASPRLLCLDEPSSGLNAEEVKTLMHSLQKLSGEGMAILLVSHDMELMEVASSVSVLCFGEIISTGAFASVKEDPRVREAYLGV